MAVKRGLCCNFFNIGAGLLKNLQKIKKPLYAIMNTLNILLTTREAPVFLQDTNGPKGILFDREDGQTTEYIETSRLVTLAILKLNFFTDISHDGGY